jgi:hypothetical protein
MEQDPQLCIIVHHPRARQETGDSEAKLHTIFIPDSSLITSDMSLCITLTTQQALEAVTQDEHDSRLESQSIRT